MEPEINKTVCFSLISASIVLAAFLPTLVYSFVKGLFEEISRELDQIPNETELYISPNAKKHAEAVKERASNIFYFYSAMDLIVSQSAFLVVLATAIAIIIYLSLDPKPVLTKNYSDIFMKFVFSLYFFFAFLFSIYMLAKYYHFEDKKRPRIHILFGDWRLYFYFLCRYFLCRFACFKCPLKKPQQDKKLPKKCSKCCDYCKGVPEKKAWPDYWKYGLVCYTLIIFYTGFSFYLINYDDVMREFNCLISLTSFMLILCAVAWIIPSLAYHPLWSIKEELSHKIQAINKDP